jgi:hypothetical protein
MKNKKKWNLPFTIDNDERKKRNIYLPLSVFEKIIYTGSDHMEKASILV